MGEVTKVDPTDLSDRELMIASLRQGEQVHHCLETHIAETRLAHLAASEARQALADRVGDLTTSMGSLETRQGVTEGAVSALAKALGGQVIEGPKPKVKVDAPMSWKDLAKIALTVLGSLSGFVLFLQIIAPGVSATWDAILKANP